MEREIEKIEDLLAENHDGHRGRLRKRIKYAGFEGLKPYEVLEFLLNYAVPRQDMTDLAKATIEQFGTLEEVLEAGSDELMRVKGMGKHAAEWLCWVGEMLYAYDHWVPDERYILSNNSRTVRYVNSVSYVKKAPSTWQVLLDSDYNVIYQRELSPSRTWADPLYTRDAMEDVIKVHPANAIVFQLVGNEYNDPEPEDILDVAIYGRALLTVNCALLDFLIVNYASVYSMRENNDMIDYYDAKRKRNEQRNLLREGDRKYVYDLNGRSLAEILSDKS